MPRQGNLDLPRPTSKTKPPFVPKEADIIALIEKARTGDSFAVSPGIEGVFGDKVILKRLAEAAFFGDDGCARRLQRVVLGSQYHTTLHIQYEGLKETTTVILTHRETGEEFTQATPESKSPWLVLILEAMVREGYFEQI